MNFWQFKFDMKKGEWKEFETITSGEVFDQSITAYKKMQGCKGDIVFYYQMDKKIGIGIHFITEIISEPYKEEYNTGYAIQLRVIKRLSPIFNDMSNKIYVSLQSKLNPMGQGASKYLFLDEDRGEELYRFLMEDNIKVNIQNRTINHNKLKDASSIRDEYIDKGYLFNAFHNLNLIKGEVKHLAFLGNLLNPYGNHFKDDLFLKYFIKSLLCYKDLEDNDILNNFINDNPNIVIEKTIKDNNNKNIGRIDLWLESDNYIIAIEGKIEAKDNKGQLKKYNEYLQEQDKKYLLLYLTLKKGEEPENIEIEELENFHLMNFEEDILEFIKDVIEDDNITNNIQNTLFDYKDALIKYMYQYHLSFEYSYALIQEITKDKSNFEKYENIKEYYYQNMKSCKNTVIEDIAENFEYAKVYIEWLFFKELKDVVLEDEYILFNHNSTVLLEENDLLIAKDLFLIQNARKERNVFNLSKLGDVEIIFDYKYDEENERDFNFSIKNSSIGIFKNMISELVPISDILENPSIFPNVLDAQIFKSNNISKLLDKKYRMKLIRKIILQ